MKYEQAKNIAVKICEQLQPYCEPEKLRIVGSVRRKKYECHDIEICCLPKTEIIIQKDLFGGEQTKIVRSEKFIEIVKGLGRIVKGKHDGRMMQIELREWIMLDLFTPYPDDFFRQLAIRTGSAFYSQTVIAAGWLKIGWCGSDKGLRKQIDCEAITLPDGKIKWKCVNPDGERPPIWQSEKYFFEWIKVPFIHPKLRT